MAMQTRELDADVAVVGGGLAGVCASLAAARLGCRVVLIQDRPVLGGNASSEIRMHVSGAEALIRGLKDGLDYRETGIIEELKLEEAARNPQRAAFMLDLVLWEAVRNESNITLLLNTACDGADVEAAELPAANDFVLSGTPGPGPLGPVRRIVRLTATRASTEERFVVTAPHFVDGSGDGRLGALAGADFCYGREGRGQYGESLAPVDEPDGKVLGSTLLFTARRYDKPMPFVAPKWARHFSEADLKLRSHRELDFGYWWVEWGGQLDTIRDNEAIRDELLAIVMGVWDHIKNGGDHGAENWAIDWIGVVPGKRESRRFYGDHVLTQVDVQGAPLFPDRVAYGGWTIDTHPPEGVDRPDERPCEQHHLAQPYSIPLRSLYSRNVVNLFTAGRDISASHVGFASTRVMGTCALIGQGAGTAAGVAALNALPAARSCLDAPWLASIQQQLLRDDAYLIELSGDDPEDLAKQASVTASSWLSGCEPEQATNGVTRRICGAENLWVSEGELPQRLWLSWPEPVSVGLVELTLDTGLHRELRLSMSEAVSARSVRGPQPETLRDFDVQFFLGEQQVAERPVRGNRQRKLRLKLDGPVRCDRIEVVALAAWEVKQARVFEVRVYSV